ncbi:MAG: response regulator [Anaerolineales bacterium]
MAEKILIVDDDLDTLRLVGLMLQKIGYQISAASNGAQGLAKALEERPDLILLDVMMPDMDGYEVTRRLRRNPATVSIPILMFTAKTQLDDKVAGFEVGADDYLTKPTHPTELQSHVKALLARSGSKGFSTDDPSSDSQKEHRGFLIGVLSARGGLGVSSFASNLAASLSTHIQDDVILAELVPGQGTLASDLGIPAQLGLSDMLGGSIAEITREKIQSSLISHSSGIKLLLASERPRDVVLTSQVENYQALVTRLSTFARFTVLDLGIGLPMFVQKLLMMCSERIVITEGHPNTVHHSKMLIDDIASLDIDRKSISVVLNNRVRSDTNMPLKQAQEKLGHPILSALTPAPELYLQAARAQTLAVISQPASITSQQFAKIVENILVHEKA